MRMSEKRIMLGLIAVAVTAVVAATALLVSRRPATTEPANQPPIEDQGARKSGGDSADSGRLSSGSLIRRNQTSALGSTERTTSRPSVSVPHQEDPQPTVAGSAPESDSVAQYLQSLREFFGKTSLSGTDKTGIASITRAILEAGPNAVPALLACMQDASEPEPLRLFAAFMLHRIADARAIAAAGALATDQATSEDVRAAAVLILTRFSDNQSVRNLLTSLAQSAENTRIANLCLDALGDVRSPQAVDALAAAISSPDVARRATAVLSLGELGEAEQDLVRERARLTLEQAGYDVVAALETPDRNEGNKEDLTILPLETYRWMSSTVHAFARGQPANAGNILHRMYPVAVDDRLRQDVVSVAGGFNESPEALALLRQALTDSTPKVRMVAAHALLAAAGTDAVSAVEQALTEEPDPKVKNEMQRALRRYQAEEQ